MTLRLNGSTSGYTEIDAPAVAGSNTITLPTGAGSAYQVIRNGATAGSLEFTDKIVSGTAQNSTSGTSIDFTGIPSWVKRVTVMFYRISTNGTSSIQVQLGDSGGVETTGYEVSSAYWADTALAYTSGFVFRQVSGSAATGTQSGQIVFNLFDASANRWTGSGSLAWTLNPVILNAGSKELSATLDRVRITTVNGTDTFDAGSINILYE